MPFGCDNERTQTQQPFDQLLSLASTGLNLPLTIDQSVCLELKRAYVASRHDIKQFITDWKLRIDFLG